MKTLLDVDYVTKDGKAVIRWFKKRDGEHVVEEDGSFEPYIYVTAKESIDVLADKVKKLENVVKVEKVKKTDNGVEVDVLKVTTQQPKDVPVLRDEIKSMPECGETREAAIPFARRCLMDSGLTPVEDCEMADLNVAAVDIETLSDGGEPDSGKNPIIMISYDDTSGISEVWTYKKPDDVNLDFLKVMPSEAEIIKKLVETIKQQKIDVIVGYNSDNFDFPYIQERAKKLRVRLDLGVDGSTPHAERRGMNMGVKIKGRPHVDLYPVCRQSFNLPRYRLEDVYESIAGEKKIDIDGREITKYWNGSSEQYRKLSEYSKADADATLKIAETVLPLQLELSRIIRQPLYETARMSSSQRVEQLLMNRALEKNILIPNRPSDRIAGERRSEKFEGAYVVEPVKGIHDNIVLFDFRSLYPSIVISHNVDPATIDCKCCNEGGYKSPTDHTFCKNVRGFIPEVLEWLINRRIEVKKKLKSAGDETEKKILDVQQQAMKLLANSMYGYYAFIRARWFCLECAEAITAWGREYIHKTIEAAKEEGFTVIYGDTDSIFLTLPQKKDKNKIILAAESFAKKVNKELPESMELEFEGYYPRGVFITKKRYALSGVDGKLTVKGLETRRRDWAEVAKDTQERVLNALLRDKSPEKAAEIVKNVVAEIKEGNVELARLEINTQMTRGMGEYVSPGPHIHAAKKAMKKGMHFSEGSIITYVITKNGASISDKARVIDFVNEGEYDPEYYVNNQVIPAVFRILEALGYQEDELKGLGKQMNLGDW